MEAHEDNDMEVDIDQELVIIPVTVVVQTNTIIDPVEALCILAYKISFVNCQTRASSNMLHLIIF